MKHVIRPSARNDILRQYEYYFLEGVPDIAVRFIDAVHESISRICQMPGIGAPKQLMNPKLYGLRVWPVQEFEEIRIYYLTGNEEIKIIRVLHGRRDIHAILEEG